MLIMYADGGLTSTATLNPQMLVNGITAPSTTAVFTPSISTTPLADPTLSQISPGVATVGDGLYLNFTLNYNPAGLTPNQSNVGAAVNLIQAYGAPAYEPVAQQIFLAPTLTALGTIYNLLSGEGTAAAQQATFEAQSSFLGAVFDHAGESLNCNRKDPTCKRRWRAWSQSSASRLDVAGNYNSASSRVSSFGQTVGADYRIQPGLAVGFALGGMWPQFQAPDRETSGNGSGVNFAIYGMAQSPQGGSYLKGAVSFGVLDNRENRMAFMTPVQGSYGSQIGGGMIEFGKRFESALFSLTPFTGAQISRLHQDAYAESDPVWGNYFFAHDQTSAPVFVGLQLDSTFVTDHGVAIQPILRAQWLHETETNRWIEAQSLAAPGFPWTSVGTSAPSDVAKVDLGVKARLTDALTLKAAFNAEFAGGAHSIGGFLAINGAY
jgi:outer membrane autotransporter protein